MKKLIKQQVKDNNSILYNNEFFITDKLYDKYKVQYFDGYILNLSRLLEEENIDTYYVNLNGSFCYLDACYLENKDLCFKNGFVMFTDPIENKCGRALILENSYVEFRECIIQTPYAEAMDMSIIELDNSLISFKNSNISVKFASNRKAFIDLQRGSELEMESTTVEAGCNETIPNYNIGFDFIKVSGEDTSIEVKNCAKIRIANDLADNGEDLEFNFIKTDENIDSTIVLFNNVIWMHGVESYRNVLNVNLDNKDIHINNNDLQGTLKVRLESSNTVSGNGYPHTYNQGEEVWDLYVDPVQLEDSLNFEFSDVYKFFNQVQVDQNDMSNIGKEFIFTWKHIGQAYGFILNYDEEETYTENDLIGFEDMSTVFGISDIDIDIDDIEEDQWLGVILRENISKFNIEETFTIQNGADFAQAAHSGKAVRVDAGIHSLSNSSIGAFDEDWFFTKNVGGTGVFRSIYLNNREYRYIPRNNTYYLEDEHNFMSAFYNMNSNDSEILDLSNKSIVCDTYLRDKSFTIKNGIIELFNEVNPFGDGTRILQLINCENVTFENITFKGYFTNTNKPVFDFIDSKVCFKNCNFEFYCEDSKTIFRLENSDLTLFDCTALIEGENNIKVIESIDNATLHIDGTQGQGRVYNDQFNINAENNGVLIDGSNGDIDCYIKHFTAYCGNNSKAIVLRITDSMPKDIINSSFLNGSFKVVPGTEIAEYQNNHHYQPGERYEEEDEEWYEGGDEFYFVENDRIRTARCIQEYTSSGDFNQDIENGYIEETTPNDTIHMNNVTYRSIEGGNPDFFIKDGNSDAKTSVAINNLYNTDIDIENFDENNGQLVYTQGTWKETKFEEIDDTDPSLEIEPGFVYNCIEPLTSLTIVSVPEGMAESIVKFKAGFDFVFHATQGLKYVGNLPDDWEENEEYIISFLIGTFTITKINTVE